MRLALANSYRAIDIDELVKLDKRPNSAELISEIIVDLKNMLL